MLTEEELYEGFGLEMPKQDEEQTSPEAVSEAAEAEQDTEVEVQEAEMPSQAEAEADPPAEREAKAEVPQKPTPTPAQPRQPKPQSGGKVRRWDQAAVDRAYESAYAGRLNPYTGQAIKSAEDYRRYREDSEDYQRKRLESALGKEGLTAEAIQQVVDQHPAVQQAKAAIQRAEAERVQAQMKEAQSWYAEQLKAINEIDPEAKLTSLEDLSVKMKDGYDKMLAHVRAGVSLADAYKLQNYDRLTKRVASAARQAQRNQEAGKGHLRQVGNGNAGQGAGVDVPAEVRRQWKELMPNITDEQIRKEYAKYQKESGN